MFNYKQIAKDHKEQILSCSHKWKSTQLIFTTVQDCEMCLVKKEEWDEVYSKEAIIEEEKKWTYPSYFI